jgi:hypothetical protein
MPHKNYVRIITGCNWEEKANKKIEEEEQTGGTLCDVACSAIPTDSSYGFDGVLILVFEKRKGGDKSGNNKNTNTTGNYDSEK